MNGSNPNPYLTLKFQAPLNLLDDMAQVAKQLAWQTGLLVEPSLGLSPHHNKQLFSNFINRLE